MKIGKNKEKGITCSVKINMFFMGFSLASIFYIIFYNSGITLVGMKTERMIERYMQRERERDREIPFIDLTR